MPSPHVGAAGATCDSQLAACHQALGGAGGSGTDESGGLAPAVESSLSDGTYLSPAVVANNHNNNKSKQQDQQISSGQQPPPCPSAHQPPATSPSVVNPVSGS